MSDTLPPNKHLPDKLTSLLASTPPTFYAEWEATPAAVLIPLYENDGEWNLLFTRRTDSLADHRGQVSFPGGRIEQSDSGAEEAAVREAFEEIGLKREDIQILGMLDALFTVTQFLIHPVVAKIPWPYPFQKNQDEVADVFGIPLQWLSNPANFEIRRRRPMNFGPSVLVYYFEPHQGHILWGATAKITVGLLEILGMTPAK